MAKYVIRIWDEAHLVKEREETRRTRTSALIRLDAAVWDVLKAFGKLDTTAAYVAMSEARNVRDIIPIGDQRSILVSNTGKRVTLSRVS